MTRKMYLVVKHTMKVFPIYMFWNVLFCTAFLFNVSNICEQKVYKSDKYETEKED